LNKLKALKGLSPLTCFTFNHAKGDWDPKDFPRDKNNIFLSASSSFDPSSDELREGNYFTLTLLDHFWFLLNRHGRENCLFDRLTRRNRFLSAYSSSLVEIGKSRFLITNRRVSSFQSQDHRPATGEPQPGEFSVRSPQGLFRYPTWKSILIGSNPISDVIIKGSSFSALIVVRGGIPYFLRLGNEEISINHQDSHDPVVELGSGDEIRIGAYSLAFGLPVGYESPEREVPVDALCLVPINPEGDAGFEKHYIPSTGYALFAGKDENCDLAILRDGVSRRHASLTVGDGVVEVEDCGSTNGTFVNNQRIEKQSAVPGNIVSFGPANFLLAWYHG
jgi:hypothetical protein